MDKDLNELTIIRLDTELENCIGHREYYLKKENYKMYAVWDQEVENVLEEIRKLGGLK